MNIEELGLLIKSLDKRISELESKIKDKPLKQKKVVQIPTPNEFYRYCEANIFGWEYYVESIVNKYRAWYTNDWKDGFDKPILNWKSKVSHSVNTLRKSNIKMAFPYTNSSLLDNYLSDKDANILEIPKEKLFELEGYIRQSDKLKLEKCI